MAATERQGSGDGRSERRRRAQDLDRDRFLDAAEELFGRRGFHETSLRDIADHGDFSVGSVYLFFENKDDLFAQVFVRRGDEFVPALADIVRGEGDPLDRLHAVVDFEVDFFRRHPAFGRLYLRYAASAARSVDRTVDRATRDRYDEAMGLQARLFADGQRAGRFRGGDPQVLARLLSGIVSAYQSMDPAVVGDDPEAPEGLPLAELHDLVARAFAAD